MALVSAAAMWQASPFARRCPVASASKHYPDWADGDYRVKKVSARKLDRILGSKRELPLVVDFYATWCGPCILVAQVLEQLAVEFHEEVTFLKVDTDEEYDLARQLEIRGLPTIVFVTTDDSKPALRTEGVLPIQVLRGIIQDQLLSISGLQSTQAVS